MIRSILLCALLAGVANAARQIPVIPSPPPPGATSDNVPGALVSLVAPDFSSSTWGTAQSELLCAALVANYTSLYEKKYIKCSVNSVVDTSAHTSAAVQAQLYWSDFSGSTTADATSRTNSRDLFVATLYNNPNNIVVGTKTLNVNDTCNAAWVPATTSPTTQNSGVYSPVSGMPLAQCRLAIRDGTVETYSTSTGKCGTVEMAQSLCFESKLPDTTGAWGIDNGKTCPLGQSQIVPVPSSLQSKVAISPVTVSAATLGGQSNALIQAVTLKLSATSSSVAGAAANLIATQSFVELGGIASASITVGGAGCTDATNLKTFLESTPLLVSATSLTATSAIGDTLTLAIDWTKAGCTGTTPPALGTGQPVTAKSVWSPYCDTDGTFYSKFGYGITGANSFSVCPRCGVSATYSETRQFVYNSAGNNAGKACRSGSYPLATGVVGNPVNVQSAGLAGSSCIQVGSANLGSGDFDNAKPMLTSSSPVPYPYSVTQYAFPSSNTACGTTTNCAATGNFPGGSVVAYKAGSDTDGNDYFQDLALDTEFGVPCSTPAVKSPISGGFTSTGIVGGYFLQSSPASVRGAGTCNTQSLFWNGGTGTAGNKITSAGSNMANLPTLFDAPIIGPTPAPAPVTPAPVPVAPSPTAPTPSSPTPLVCTYRGTYEITPLYGPCNKYYIASGTKSNCAENFVHLRTKSNLGGKYDRVRWAIAATAQNGVGTPTRVVAEARSGVGACTNRNLAAPSNPIPGLKVGGSSWQWQFRPYPDSAECDHVNMISENRLDTTAFLSVPKPCKTFRYNESDGGRQRFKLIKV